MQIRRQNLHVLLAALILSGLLQGCDWFGRGPYLQLHVCVKNDKGLKEFVDLMQSIANAETLRFTNRSQATLWSYEVSRENIPNFEYKLPVMTVVMFGLNNDDGAGVIATNLALFPYQLSVGFLDKPYPSEAERANSKRFADVVVKELEKRWAVNPPPVGSGVVPRDDCIDAPVSAPTGQQ